VASLRADGGTVRLQTGATVDGGTLSGGPIHSEAFNTLADVTLAGDAWLALSASSVRRLSR